MSILKEMLQEKWATDVKVSASEKGKYKDATIAELQKALDALKKSGPHKKGSTEYGKMRELMFAIRAKKASGKKWSGVTTEGVQLDENTEDKYTAAIKSLSQQIIAMAKEDSGNDPDETEELIEEYIATALEDVTNTIEDMVK